MFGKKRWVWVPRLLCVVGLFLASCAYAVGPGTGVVVGDGSGLPQNWQWLLVFGGYGVLSDILGSTDKVKPSAVWKLLVIFCIGGFQAVLANRAVSSPAPPPAVITNNTTVLAATTGETVPEQASPVKAWPGSKL